MFDPILVTGATGYVGGRLVLRLLDAGYRVRVLVRNPSQLQGRSWVHRVDVVHGDVFNGDSLGTAMKGIEAAFYLIHSMSNSEDFQSRDLAAAQSFGHAGKAAGVKRIIYLGGLSSSEENLSTHLRSRHEVGRILAQYDIPVIEFRSGVIVGSGSAAFEMMRYTVEGMPILFCPSWVNTHIQPISVRDVLDYLVAALKISADKIGSHGIIEIGGADVLTYQDMMRGYAQARGLHRVMLMAPFLPMSVWANWLHWMTPIPAPLAQALIEGLRNEVIVQSDQARILFPEIEPHDYATSLERALMRIATDNVETTWSDAQISATGDAIPVTLTTREGLLLERRQRNTSLPASLIYRVFTGLGGNAAGCLQIGSGWRAGSLTVF